MATAIGALATGSPILWGCDSDRVLMYQHDLAETTMSTEREALTWNMAFGNQLSATRPRLTCCSTWTV